MENARQVIVFQLKDEEYVVPVLQVASIERLSPITRVPHTESFVKGVINLRGIITPVIDLNQKMGRGPHEKTESTRIIIVSLDGMEAGMMVDGANDVVEIPDEKIETAQDVKANRIVEADYIEGVAYIDGRVLVLLNLSTIFTQSDIGSLQPAAEEGK